MAWERRPSWDQAEGCKRRLLSHESSELPHRLVQQHFGHPETFSFTKQLNVMAEDAALSYHQAIRCFRLIAYFKMSAAFENSLFRHQAQEGQKAPGFRCNPVGEESGGEKTTGKKKQEIQGCEYLGAVNSADGRTTPLGSKVGVQVPMVQHE